MAMERYMVIETFLHGPEPVYARYASKGRMLANGLTYCDSWLANDGCRCFQLMETENAETFDQWTIHWVDIVDFEIIRLRDQPGKSDNGREI